MVLAHAITQEGHQGGSSLLRMATGWAADGLLHSQMEHAARWEDRQWERLVVSALPALENSLYHLPVAVIHWSTQASCVMF